MLSTLQNLAEHPEPDYTSFEYAAGLLADACDLARVSGAGHLAVGRKPVCSPHYAIAVVGRIQHWLDQQQPKLLLTVHEVASILNASPASIYRLSDGGRMPRPVKLGASVRWSRAEIENWIAGGCKSRKRV